MKSRAKSRPKLVTTQAGEFDASNEAAFKHYDNKFFDMDASPAEDPPASVPEIQELQQYVKNCYDTLYKDFNAFKSTVTSKLLSLQEEVTTLSYQGSGRNEDASAEAVKESPSRQGTKAVEGRTEKNSQWHSKARLDDLKEYEKVLNASGSHNAKFHHEFRPIHRSGNRSPAAATDEPSPVKRPSYEELIQHIPASAWSTKATESSSRGGPERKQQQQQQEASYLSRHLHGSHSPKGGKTRSDWSPEKSNELLSTTTTAWQEEVEVESKEYDEAEEENEEAIEKMVSEFSKHSRDSSSLSNGQGKAAGAGRDRFMLHGWAASFLPQSTDGQLPKSINKQYGKQDILKFNDKERTSKLVASEDTRTEPSVAEMELTSKRPGVALAKGNLSRSNSQGKNPSYMSLNSSKPTGHEKRESKDTNQKNSDGKFPGKKCRGGIAWTVDELAEQNKQRAVN